MTRLRFLLPTTNVHIVPHPSWKISAVSSWIHHSIIPFIAYRESRMLR